ncbi:MAG: hypothetical protein QOJ99_6119 [Bryobacterales bacterium]|jgi:hypothetical protein|nr:hypothetical protein [Bryobacterales bacterium]
MTGPLPAIDLKRVAAEVSAQHGIRIDPDDPMLAVVTLNRMVFEQAVNQVLQQMQAAARDFEVAVDKVQIRAGGILAQEVRDCGVAMREEFAKTSVAHQPVCSTGDMRPKTVAGWFVIVSSLALALFSFGAWVGRSW